MALLNIVRTSDGRTTLFTIVLAVAGGTYIEQASVSSLRECIEQLDSVVDWDAVVPAVTERRFAGIHEVSSLPSTVTLEAYVDGKPATVVIVATQPA